MPGEVGRIFLSYRREDTRHLAGRLADRLADRFGSAQVFMDVDTIEPGVDFASALTQAVGSCDVLIAMIGRSWLTIEDRYGHRKLDNPADFVVLEIQTALNRDIRVIPVLVDGAAMPRTGDLPEVLRGLARRNAARLDHETFRSDVNHLLTALERILAAGAYARPSETADSSSAEQVLKSPESDTHPINPATGTQNASSNADVISAPTGPHRQAIPYRVFHGTSLHPRVLPMYRVVGRIALWWGICTSTTIVVIGFISIVIGRNVSGAVGASVLLLAALAGLVRLLRRELLAQRRMLETARKASPDDTILPLRALSPRHVLRVAVSLAIVAIVFGVLIAVIPSPSGT